MVPGVSRPGLFTFPDPVNEVAARLVAAGVVAMTAAVAVFDVRWVLVPLAYGFVARVFTGPTLSPLGQIVTRLVVPRTGLAERAVPGAPKRFAQGIGAVLSVSALAAWLLGAPTLARVFAGAILGVAALEAFIGFCLGCVIYGQLARLGVVADACPECADITLRPARRAPDTAAA
jgi:Domain of unknown function (DUF4395)